MHVLSLLVAVLIGAMIPFQIGANRQFGEDAGGGIYGAAANFVIGAVFLMVVMLAMRTPMIGTQQLAKMPWWAYVGGFIGVFYVYGALKIAPQIGPVLFLSLLIFGQMCSSLLLEHFGAMVYPRSPISFGKVVGVAFLLGGVFLIPKF